MQRKHVSEMETLTLLLVLLGVTVVAPKMYFYYFYLYRMKRSLNPDEVHPLTHATRVLKEISCLLT